MPVNFPEKTALSTKIGQKKIWQEGLSITGIKDQRSKIKGHAGLISGQPGINLPKNVFTVKFGPKNH